MNKFWKIVKVTFWAAIIAASIFIIFTSLNLFGYQMFVVKSGSMEPKIRTGSAVIDKKASSYNLGDVITFKTTENSTVTHRVVKVENKDGKTTYIVKGDANNSPDPDKVLNQNVVGKVLFGIPLLGYLIAFMRTLPGLILFILVPALIIIAEEISNIKTETKNVKAKRKEAKRSKTNSKKIDDLIIPPDLIPEDEPPKKSAAKRDSYNE